MDSGEFKYKKEIDISNLKSGRTYYDEKICSFDGIDISIEFDIFSDRTLFSIKFIAEPENILPLKINVQSTVSYGFSNKIETKEELEFESSVNSNKVYFPISIEKLKLSNKPIKLEIKISKSDQSFDSIPSNIQYKPSKIPPSSKEPSYQPQKSSDSSTNTNLYQPQKSSDSSTNTNLYQPQKSSDSSTNANSYRPPKSYDSSSSTNSPVRNHDSSASKQLTRLDSDFDSIQYNGLYNQGATCYINSAIQALFFLPLFRKTIYEIPTQNEKDPERSVSLNLQSLFYSLQFGKATCSTKNLTNSFGWNNGEVFKQEDIGEFLKQLINVLEEKMKLYDNMKNKINFIFGGETIQIISSASGKTLAENKEIFTDLPVEVKETLRESLQKFTKKEIISDYIDSGSSLPQTVYYQTLFTTLPRVLQVHIKRYKYDIYKGVTQKNNKKMAYEDELDLKPFVHDKNSKQCTKYKLYSVIVHSGAAIGGHYYVYCKPDIKKSWFKFNDQFVNIVKDKNAIEDNFGGYETYSGIKFEKEYSAYMLIYVRLDVIDEVFLPINESDAPQHVVNYSKERHQIEEQSFTIYNDACVWKNCQNGVASFINKKCAFTVSVDKNANGIQLYEAVSNKMKIDVSRIRLWLVDDEKALFYRVLKPEKQLFLARYQNLYAQIKDENEDLVLDKYSKVVFILLYTPLIFNQPFYFLKVGQYQKHTDKYKNIFDDALNSINKAIGTKYGKLSCDLYKMEENPDKAYDFSDFDCENGQFLIFQFNKKQLEQDQLDQLGERLKIVPFFFEDGSDQTTDSAPTTIKFLDYMQSKLPDKLTDYLNIKYKNNTSRIYDYQDTSHQIGTIEFPAQINYKELTDFIQVAFDIPVGKKESLLLFACEENSLLPKEKPFNTSTTSIRSSVDLLDLKRIFYYVAGNSVAQNRYSETRVIQLSKDAFTIDKTICYFMPKDEVHPLDQFESFNEDFFQSKNPRRMLIVDEKDNLGKIINDPNDETIKINNKNKLRIETIPSDQINSELMVVYQGILGIYKYELIEERFYYSYIPNEPISKFKDRLKKSFAKFRDSNIDFKVVRKNFSNYDSAAYQFNSDKIFFEKYQDKEIVLIYKSD